MNEADIKKCIKNGYAWSSCGEKPEKTPTRDYMRGHLKTFDGLHATKCEAQAAIDARKADSDHDHLFRTWKGPLTEEAAKKLREGDEVWSFALGELPTIYKIKVVVNSPQVQATGTYLSESEAKAAAHDIWLADRRENQMKAIDDEQDKQLLPDDETWTFCVNGPVKADCRITRVGCFFAEKAARVAWLAEMRSHQMEPISKEQKKMLCKGDFIFCAHDGRVIGVSYSSFDPDWMSCPDDYFSEKAAQSALDKAKSVASHETPSGETQAKEVSTGETQTVLEEAMKCVGGPRRRDYGTPDENFGRIADLWNVHLKGKLAKPVTPGDVAMLMILLKVARHANSPKRDNLVDIAGYAQCASELKEDK